MKSANKLAESHNDWLKPTNLVLVTIKAHYTLSACLP
jgi:hypothetical protein